LEKQNTFSDISFLVHAGEILGFSGLVGAGRTEVVRALTGADKLDGGEIYVDGKKTRIKNPRDSISAGIAFLTEDRKGQGLVLLQSVEFNSTLVNLILRQKNFLSISPKFAWLHKKWSRTCESRCLR
jgi:ribose transport system ATP-binding protein